jgi:hypothetical protein
VFCFPTGRVTPAVTRFFHEQRVVCNSQLDNNAGGVVDDCVGPDHSSNSVLNFNANDIPAWSGQENSSSGHSSSRHSAALHFA